MGGTVHRPAGNRDKLGSLLKLQRSEGRACLREVRRAESQRKPWRFPALGVSGGFHWKRMGHAESFLMKTKQCLL